MVVTDLAYALVETFFAVLSARFTLFELSVVKGLLWTWFTFLSPL